MKAFFLLALKCLELENKDVLHTLDPRLILQCFNTLTESLIQGF